ncbi:Lipase_3 domain-containing protein [Pseudozyma hubeiensis]|nr:Lipase_3 domain-containing protein [Pseudozyma hubeiensis]
MTPTTSPPSTDLRKRPMVNAQMLIGPGHADKHADLCAKLCQRQVTEVVQVSDRGSAQQNWFAALISDLYYYFFKWLPIAWWVTLTSLPQVLFDPIGFWTALVFASVATVVLFGTLIFSAIWRLPFVQDRWQAISARTDVGLGNFAYPLIFEFVADPQNKQIRDAAFTVMSNPCGAYAKPSTAEERNFDLEVSKILMMISALVYERNVGAYHKAARSAQRAKKLKKQVTCGRDVLTEAGREVGNHLGRADSKIRRVANEWGLNYASISELATNTSPLCGAFWHPDHNFIILAFKGTDPVEFKEWAIDFTFDYTDGRAWLPGFSKVHAGFYDQLFPQDLNHATGAFPYTEIRTAINQIATEIRATSYCDHVNLFVTGHSLGAGLASLFYARAIASPKDFGQTEEGFDQIRVRDAYCFGTPIVGDPDCISAFNQACHERDLDHPQMLWRVTSRRDAVATLLPDAGDNHTLRHISPLSQLHFAHIGQEVQLSNNINKVYTGPGTLLPTQTPVYIVSHLDRDGEGPEVSLPPVFKLLEYVPLVRRLVAHIPSSYWDRLTKVHAGGPIEYARTH